MAHRLIEPAQIRAARALLNISQMDLAQASEVGIATIKRLEAAEDVLRVTAGVLVRIQTAFETAGVEFVPEDETMGCGVRLRRRMQTKTPPSRPNISLPNSKRRRDPRAT